MSKDKNQQAQDGNTPARDTYKVIPVSGMYKDWFLDYASYVILERAVPAIEDGFKPVQRRILHAMRQMEDGRFHKVANIIGQTMAYHPHGDAAIGDALVNLGQKDLLIETQGNWGDIRTGDPAAAARYIEARLSKFALEVVFNPQTTRWQLSYDGRKKEPVTLPVKFPLLLALGVEGIAVGLATRIMPHNFIELCQASIDILKGNEVEIFPDFPTGGIMDCSEYNDGLRGGRIKVRAKIEQKDKQTLVIREIPYGTTTTSLIDSIIKANEKNKIKIKRVVDNTAQDVEIEIELPPGTSPDVTLDALYAFTDCEVSISPNACVIVDDHPEFLGVSEILKKSTENTVALLRQELQIKLDELLEKWHFSSLEKIFIENRIYRDIEECETWEAVIETIDKGMHRHVSTPSRPNTSAKAVKLNRDLTEEDIIRLTEIKIKRISRYDSFKMSENIRQLEQEMEQTRHHLEHITDYAIAWFQNLMDKYGKGRERKTRIRTMEVIDSREVAIANEKLYVNRKEGFVGYGLKKDEYICDCSDIDDIIVFLEDGRFTVTRISEKAFIGKNIIHAGVWKKGDERMIYHMIYRDGKTGRTFAKRFAVTSVTRDKMYDLTTGTPGSKVLYFSANPNSEEEVVTVYLRSSCRARNKVFDFDFGTLAIKGRNARGNTVTKYPVSKIVHKALGESTLGGRDIWIDETVGRINTDGRGRYLGAFDTDDLLLIIYKDGTYETSGIEYARKFEMPEVALIEKFNPEKPVSVIYYEGQKKNYFVKRFLIETSKTNTRFCFIGDHPDSHLILVSTATNPVVEVTFYKGRQKEEVTEHINIAEFIDVKGWKSLGIRLSRYKIKSLKWVESSLKEAAESPDGIESASVQEGEGKPGSKPEKAAPAGNKPEEGRQPTQTQPKDDAQTISIGSHLEWDIDTTRKNGDAKPPAQGKLFE